MRRGGKSYGRRDWGSGVPAGLFATAVVLLLLVLSASTRPLMTVALGCLVAAMVGVWPGSVLAHRGRRRELVGTGALLRANAAGGIPVRIAPLSSTMPAGPTLPITVAAVAGGLQVRWWRRDGQDRLYVTNSAGTSLGWMDRGTGALRVFDERHRAAVERALRSARSEADRRSA